MPVIVHLSDLHFGAKGQAAVWRALAGFLAQPINSGGLGPDLVLVTGDLANSPKHLAEAASSLGQLQVPWYACAGNHDRWWLGNRLPFLGGRPDCRFEKLFLGHVGAPNAPALVPLGRLQNRWDVALLFADSSDDTDFFARGHVSAQTCRDIMADTALESVRAADLVLLLVHHHPVPILALEERAQASTSDLARVTSMVNGATFIEASLKAGVDVVLHGHEHAANVAKHCSVDGIRREVCIVACASSGGAVAANRAELNAASFNIIDLKPDRSVEMRTFEYFPPAFREKLPRHLLLRAVDTRRARFLRNAPREEDTGRARLPHHDSRLVRHFEFLPGGDILVRDQCFGCQGGLCWSDGTWSRLVRNSTGKLVEARMAVGPAGAGEAGLKQLPEKAIVQTGDPHEAHAKKLSCPVKELTDLSPEAQPIDLRLALRWENGGILLKSEMDALNAGGNAGLLRNEGREFAGARVSCDVAALTVSVRLPREFAPLRVDARVTDMETHEVKQQESDDAQRRLIKLDEGAYMLNVSYPRRGCRYSLHWLPVVAPLGSPVQGSAPATPT